jgi:hypothetical protein
MARSIALESLDIGLTRIRGDLIRQGSLAVLWGLQTHGSLCIHGYSDDVAHSIIVGNLPIGLATFFRVLRGRGSLNQSGNFIGLARSSNPGSLSIRLTLRAGVLLRFGSLRSLGDSNAMARSDNLGTPQTWFAR